MARKRYFVERLDVDQPDKKLNYDTISAEAYLPENKEQPRREENEEEATPGSHRAWGKSSKEK